MKVSKRRFYLKIFNIIKYSHRQLTTITNNLVDHNPIKLKYTFTKESHQLPHEGNLKILGLTDLK